METPLIIGFGHRSGVGKDTSAKFLDTHFRCKVPKVRTKKISFADKLKDITYQLYAWTGIKRPIHYENKREDRNLIIEPLGMTIVDLWVLVGEKLREVYPKTWLDYTIKHQHNADVLIIPDVRHPNEAAAILESGGYVCKITNPRVEVRQGHSIDDMLEDFDDWSFEFLNDGSIEKLNSLMDSFSDLLIQKYHLRG